MPSVFSVATWNILATSYIRATQFPGTPGWALDPAWREPAVVRHAAALDVDVLCLQEVERALFEALVARLSRLGYRGTLVSKANGRPDGCATFLRESRCRAIAEERLVYSDGVQGGRDSGHIAQVVVTGVDGVRLSVLNTHLKWDPPGTRPEQQIGLRQMRAALARADELRAESTVQLICGDFNATPDSDLVALLEQAGFERTHHLGFTGNSNREPKLIDYLFVRGPVTIEPTDLAPIDSATILPSLEQPSDHLPVVARLAAAVGTEN
jgi:mRNA deadenylase 3'-5' endonuclease subunit Ccr4